MPGARIGFAPKVVWGGVWDLGAVLGGLARGALALDPPALPLGVPPPPDCSAPGWEPEGDAVVCELVEVCSGA